MKAALAIALLSQAIAYVNAAYYDYGCSDKCFSQVKGNYNGRADCTRYLKRTITSGTSTKTTTTTVKATSTKTSKTTTTTTSITTETDTVTVTSSNTETGTVTVTVGVVVTNTVPTVVTITNTVGALDTSTVPITETLFTTGTTTLTSGTLIVTLSPDPVTDGDYGATAASTTSGPSSASANAKLVRKELEERGTYGPPSPRLAGQPDNCKQWAFVRSTDTTYSLINRYYASSKINRVNLLKWNPTVKSNAADWYKAKGTFVCIALDTYPSYASDCNSSKYTSVCSGCMGIMPTTKKVFAATSTSKCFVTSTSTKTTILTSTATATSTEHTTTTTTVVIILNATAVVSETSTSTATATSTSTDTATATTTSTTTITSTGTATIGVTNTQTVPQLTTTTYVCPTGYTECSGSCVNTLTSNTNCGGCNNKCSTSCQAGACAGCTADTSTCSSGGGRTCDDGSTCICILNVEGQRLCAISSGCMGAICAHSSECGVGYTCVPGTCCGAKPVCMRTPEGCPNGQTVQRIFKRSPGAPSKRRVLVPEFDPSWKFRMMEKKP
ncbi:hypothetical protein H072_938 [Dactylellina haptotyla CBS 200.50]|uniref:LysM domain-containing protein n=1 Tax=Dactylellina haptotyla (strain CBS 200.50) TaxID=1284197 RepID=S8AVH4_DACHA|nr:hypothetical protein H072_938 [Dactylellina haptotyla CBS 200.50]